jgi:hypothetical protein
VLVFQDDAARARTLLSDDAPPFPPPSPQ